MKDDNFVEFKILLVNKNRKENKKRKVTKRNYITKDLSIPSDSSLFERGLGIKFVLRRKRYTLIVTRISCVRPPQYTGMPFHGLHTYPMD